MVHIKWPSPQHRPTWSQTLNTCRLPESHRSLSAEFKSVESQMLTAVFQRSGFSLLKCFLNVVCSGTWRERPLSSGGPPEECCKRRLFNSDCIEICAHFCVFSQSILFFLISRQNLSGAELRINSGVQFFKRHWLHCRWICWGVSKHCCFVALLRRENNCWEKRSNEDFSPQL